METVEPIKIPSSHIEFANAVAVLAEQHGIAEFNLEYEPHWTEQGEPHDRRVRGKAMIHFKAKDGRGRPCRNLNVTFNAAITHVIESNEPSFN